MGSIIISQGLERSGFSVCYWWVMVEGLVGGDFWGQQVLRKIL